MNKEQLPAWNLNDLYKSIDDPQINVDLEQYKTFCEKFACLYKGKLASLDSKDVFNMLRAYEKNSSLGSRIAGFAYLNMVTQMKNQKGL